MTALSTQYEAARKRKYKGRMVGKLQACDTCVHLWLCRQRVTGCAPDGLRSVVCESERDGEERFLNLRPDATWRANEYDREYRATHKRSKKVELELA